MKTILLIEDNHANRVLVERIVEPLDHQLLLANDGESGLQLAISKLPDLILIDMGLPDIDGQTVVTLLRQVPGLIDVPIIAFTAWPEAGALEMATRYGCDGCITKPIDARLLPQQLDHYLAR